MEIVKILLIAIGGYGANYMKELTEKNVTNAKIEGICEVMPGIEKRFPIINEKNIPLYQNIEDFYQEHEADLAVIATPMHRAVLPQVWGTQSRMQSRSHWHRSWEV